LPDQPDIRQTPAKYQANISRRERKLKKNRRDKEEAMRGTRRRGRKKERGGKTDEEEGLRKEKDRRIMGDERK
jgi:hypothetical protein